MLSGQVNRTNNDDLPEGIEPAINQHRPEVGRWIQIPCSFTLYSLFPVIPFSSSARGVFQDQTNGRLILVAIAGEHSANCVIKRKKKKALHRSVRPAAPTDLQENHNVYDHHHACDYEEVVRFLICKKMLRILAKVAAVAPVLWSMYDPNTPSTNEGKEHSRLPSLPLQDRNFMSRFRRLYACGLWSRNIQSMWVVHYDPASVLEF